MWPGADISGSTQVLDRFAGGECGTGIREQELRMQELTAFRVRGGLRLFALEAGACGRGAGQSETTIGACLAQSHSHSLMHVSHSLRAALEEASGWIPEPNGFYAAGGRPS